MDESSPYVWWKHGVIYQVYPRSFKDTTGNGVGDLQGIIDKLDYLVELGVTAIWISPCYPSPMADFGYDITNYKDIHPMFGTLATMDRLIKAAHSRNLHIILDFVPNHTSDQHPAFVESRSSRDNPKRDWYVWRDPRPDGSPPNNWLSLFGGSAWEFDEKTGQYYLHSFLKEQPDLNWRNPEVKEAMFDVLRFWLDRGVDGFRTDVAHFIMKDPNLRDNPPNLAPKADYLKPLGEYDSQLHLYDKGHPDVHKVFMEMRQLLDEYSEIRPRMVAGEIHIFNIGEWATYYGRSGDELHLPLNFSLIKAGWEAMAVRQVVDAVEATIPSIAWPNYVLGNHDEPRLATRYGLGAARVAAMLLLTLRGTPTLYYGDEIGMLDGDIPPDKIQDPWPLRSGLLEITRDPCRTPMQWTDDSGADFSPPNADGTVPAPWLPIHANYKAVNVSVQEKDPTSMLNLYRSLLHYRQATPALIYGSYVAHNSPEGTFVFSRMHDEQHCLVALNFTDEEKRIQLTELERGNIVLSTWLDRQGLLKGQSLTLRGNEGCIVAPVNHQSKIVS